MPNIPNMRDMALNLLMQNPNVANNPNAQEFIQVIQNGDAQGDVGRCGSRSS